MPEERNWTILLCPVCSSRQDVPLPEVAETTSVECDTCGSTYIVDPLVRKIVEEHSGF